MSCCGQKPTHSAFVTGQVVRHTETGEIFTVISIHKHAPRSYNLQSDEGVFNQNGTWFVNTIGPTAIHYEKDLEIVS